MAGLFGAQLNPQPNVFNNPSNPFAQSNPFNPQPNLFNNQSNSFAQSNPFNSQPNIFNNQSNPFAQSNPFNLQPNVFNNQSNPFTQSNPFNPQPNTFNNQQNIFNNQPNPFTQSNPFNTQPNAFNNPFNSQPNAFNNQPNLLNPSLNPLPNALNVYDPLNQLPNTFPMNGQSTLKDIEKERRSYCEKINITIFEYEEDSKEVDELISENENMLRNLNDQLQPVLTHSRQIEAVLAADQDVLEGVQDKLDNENHSIQGVVNMMIAMNEMAEETAAVQANLSTGQGPGGVGGLSSLANERKLERMNQQSKRFFLDLAKTFESKMRLLETEIKSIQHTLNTHALSSTTRPPFEASSIGIASSLSQLEANMIDMQKHVEDVQAKFRKEKLEFLKILKENNLENTDLANVIRRNLGDSSVSV